MPLDFLAGLKVSPDYVETMRLADGNTTSIPIFTLTIVWKGDRRVIRVHGLGDEDLDRDEVNVL